LLARIRGKETAHLQGRLRLHLVHQRVRDALIELRAVSATLHPRRQTRTCESTFIASCGVIAPDVISSSSESVSAIPSLRARQRPRASVLPKARARRAAVELVVGAVAGRHVCCCRGRAAAGEVKPGKRPRAGSTRRPAAFVIAAPTRATRALTSRLRLDLALYTQISDCSDPPIFMGALSLYPDIRARYCPDTARVSLSGSKPPSPSESICAFGAAWSSCLRLRQALLVRGVSVALIRNGGRRRFHR
jgi:hypothetical protein